MKTITAKSLKDLVNDENNIKVMRSLFQAVAYCEVVRGVIGPKQQEIIDFYRFEIDEKWIKAGDTDKRITSEKRMYLASEEDFQIYLNELEKFYYSEECPFKPKEKGNCPLLEAESFVRDVKRDVAEFFKDYFGFGYDEISRSLQNYKEYYELLMTMFADKVGEITVDSK